LFDKQRLAIIGRCRAVLPPNLLVVSGGETPPYPHRLRAIGHPFEAEAESQERCYRALWNQPGKVLAGRGLLKGKTLGVDATTLEANAAMRSIVRRDSHRARMMRAVRHRGLLVWPEDVTWACPCTPAEHVQALREGTGVTHVTITVGLPGSPPGSGESWAADVQVVSKAQRGVEGGGGRSLRPPLPALPPPKSRSIKRGGTTGEFAKTEKGPRFL